MAQDVDRSKNAETDPPGASTEATSGLGTAAADDDSATDAPVDDASDSEQPTVEEPSEEPSAGAASAIEATEGAEEQAPVHAARQSVSDEKDSASAAARSGSRSADEPSPRPARPRRWTSKLWWALPVLMIVEFYFYGHNGRLEICVGKQGDTDFALVGQKRTDDNRWKFPRCETRLNLGLRSQYDTQVAEGTEVACRGATIFRYKGEAKACTAAEQGWQHRVEGHFVPPWDPAYYEHLFWFFQ